VRQTGRPGCAGRRSTITRGRGLPLPFRIRHPVSNYFETFGLADRLAGRSARAESFVADAEVSTRVQSSKHTAEEVSSEALERFASDPWHLDEAPLGIADDCSSPLQTWLCVDLDGTLLRGDMVWECIVSLFRVQPLALFLIPVWLLRGVARCKEELAKRAKVDVTALPYRTDIILFLNGQREQGRRIVLATAADVSLAKKVAEHLGIFDAVYATQDGHNLKGKAKAALLRAEFGESGYEYIGDSPADLPVWKDSRAAYVVGSERLVRKAQAVTRVEGVFDSQPASLETWLSALRVHHWVKNALLFLPLLLAHRFTWSALQTTTVGFLLFGLCASSIYIVNDLLDLHSDRAHPWKSRRPFASGKTSIPDGLLISGLLAGTTIALGFLLNVQFGLVLILYILTTMVYSVYLKRVALLDVFVLSSFYVIRIWAGALAASVPLSDWFLAFSLFFFLSLATAKRYSELMHAGALVDTGNSGRGYIHSDRELLMPLGIGSSFAAIIILALYQHSQELLLLYPRPEPLLLICPILLYWLSSIWLKAGRGKLDDDPLTLSVRDRATYVVAGAILLVMAYSAGVL
jgi:4-hydroxybenzoate polyprenyltransferase/phosphoserine phosphatase